MTAPILITWTALRGGGACEDGIREHFPALIAAGIDIPDDETTISIDLLTLVQVLGVDVALSAAGYAQVDTSWWRLFAADCAERALLREREAGREPDPRSWAAIEVARRYARGEATAAELAAARAAARAAAGAAAMAAARGAAGAAAWSAECAAWAAAWAAWAAAWAAGAAEWSTERAWQTQRLTLYLTGAQLPPVDLEPA